jgi:hypothetical protein
MKIAARQRIDHLLPMSERFKLGKNNLLYQSSALGSVGALAAAGVLPWATLAAYVPMAAQGLYGTLRLNRDMKFKNLGLALLGQSLLFGSALAMAL